jgi:hypothetical protein
VTNVENLWGNISTLRYEEADLLNDLNNGTVSFDLSYYQSVPAQSKMFWYSPGIKALHAKTFVNGARTFGKNSDAYKNGKYDLSNIFGF